MRSIEAQAHHEQACQSGGNEHLGISEQRLHLKTRTIDLEPVDADGGNEKLAVEFKVTVQDTPGTLARLGTILGEAGVKY